MKKQLPEKLEKKALELLDGVYEFAVINPHPRRDGPQEPELNRLEVRITPQAIMVRPEWSIYWSTITYDMAMKADELYNEAIKRGFHDGVSEAMAKTGVKLVVVDNRNGLSARSYDALPSEGKHNVSVTRRRS